MSQGIVRAAISNALAVAVLLSSASSCATTGSSSGLKGPYDRIKPVASHLESKDPSLSPLEYLTIFAEGSRRFANEGLPLSEELISWMQGEAIDYSELVLMRDDLEVKILQYGKDLLELDPPSEACAKFREVYFDDAIAKEILDLCIDSVLQENPPSAVHVEALLAQIQQSGVVEHQSLRESQLIELAKSCGVDWLTLVNGELAK